MIIPDANVLVYAHDERAPLHKKARAWWEETLRGAEPIGLPWVVLLAVTRLLTHPVICESPLSVEQVRELVERWFESPSLRMLQLSQAARGRFFEVLEEAGGGGNLSTAALIALYAMEHSARVASNDRDFERFGGVKWFNPLE